MQIDYTDTSGVDQTLTMGVSSFTPKRTPHTSHAKTDRRNVIEITHFGIEESVSFKIPFFDVSRLPEIKPFDLAVSACNTFTISDPAGDMPEYDLPATFVRSADALPVLARIGTCKHYSYTVQAVRVE